MDHSAPAAPTASQDFYTFAAGLSALRRGAGGGDAGPDQAEPGAGGEAAVRLESRANNPGSDLGDVSRVAGRIVTTCKCGVRTCGKGCGVRLGWIARQRLLKTADLWRSPCLCTLTGDPKRFDNDPRKMFETITAGGFIPELFKRLGVRRWVRVLEFHKSGFPHFHVMIDRGDLPGGKINYKLAWHLWRDLWGLGGLDFTRKKVNASGTPIAGTVNQIFYITKYLTKFPEQGFPSWVLGMHGLRFVQGSRDLGPLVSAPGKKQVSRDTEPTTYRARRSLGERMIDCGKGSRIFTVTEVLGAVKFSFEGVLPVSPARLRELADESDLGCVLLDEVVAGRPSVVLVGESVDTIRSRLGFPSAPRSPSPASSSAHPSASSC